MSTDRHDLRAFIDEVAVALHACGAPAHRLEAAISALGTRLGVTLTCFATPTSLLLADEAGTRLFRVEPAAVDLGLLVEVDAVAAEVAAGQLDVAAGRERLHRRRPAPSKALALVAWAVASACAAAFFGGSELDVAVASALGLLSGLIDTIKRLGNITELVAAAAVAAAATLLASRYPLSAPVLTLAALIVFLPGFTLTVGMAELATRNLVAGTARLAGAGTTFLLLGLGAAVGWRLSSILPIGPGRGLPLAEGWQVVGIPAMGLALVVLFRARWRDAPAIVAASALVWLASHFAQPGGLEVAAAAGALTAGLLGNAWSRAGHGPSSVLTMPSVLLLVPGSIGFRSIEALMDTDVTVGVDAAFRMFVVAMALVAGLLTANLVRQPLRSL